MSLVNRSMRICCKWCIGLFLLAGALLEPFEADAASCFSAPSGLVGWWPGDGNALTIIGTNNGTLQGGATTTGAGVVGSAFTFDGTNSFVQIADSQVLHPTNFTIETWVQFSGLDSAGSGGSPAGDQYIIFKQNTRNADFEGIDISKTRLAGVDRFRFLVSSPTGQFAEMESASTISTNVWYHIAAVRGTNFTQLYVNGVLERQTNVAFAQDYGTLPLFFGTSGQSFWDHKFKGTLDEVSLYNRVLSPAEILAIYSASNSGKCKAVEIAIQPQSQALGTGGNAQFTVAATGLAPLTYQWAFNGANIAGATNSSLTISNIQPANGGNYAAVVSNSFGAVTSSVAVLTVLLPPNITSQPASRTNVAGTDATFAVGASGTPAPGFQWQFNGANINGATGANLTVSNVQAVNAGNYSVIATNVAGAVTSSVAVLTVWLPPNITSQPTSRTNVTGTSATFSVGAGGTTPLNYQWQFNDVSIGGATASSLTLNNIQLSDAGSYAVVITNVSGVVTSSVAVLTVWVPPAISLQPSSQTNVIGTDATFSVLATGIPGVSYQWQFNGANIPGAIVPLLILNNVQLTNGGNYTVVATNAAGSITSSVAVLTIWAPPAIIAQPASATNIVGSTANFSLAATGTAPLSYQWQFGGNIIAGATASSLSLDNVQLSSAGDYSAVVTNVAGAATSAVATLTIWVPPAISVQPVSRTNLTGTSATFSTIATGTAPLSYQWQLGGAAISGATASSLTLNNVQLSDAGNYAVAITNVAGSLTSSIATLTVWAPPAIATQPQSITNIAGTTATFNVAASGTLPLIYQWQFNGLNIDGATVSTLALNNVQPNVAGNYTIAITNVGGALTSAVASLTIWVPPSISLPPISQAVIAGSNAVLSVLATGTLPLSYQWQLYGTNLVNGGNITGATSPGLAIFAAQTNNAGPYTVVITNVAATLTSSPPAQLTVNVPPSISAQPQSLTVLVGSNVTFTVGASGTSPLFYQWRSNGTDLPEGPNFIGTTAPTLSIPNAQPDQAAAYTVLITNAAASVLSSIANLLVINPDVAVFCDTNLEDAVRLQLGRSTGAITRLDLLNLTFLIAADSHITCLGGLEWATNLSTLYLDGNLISDISVMTNLTQLTNLFLPHNLLGNLSPLATLTNLTRLDARYNPTIVNFNNVAGPPNLTEAYFGGSSLNNFGFLPGLTRLTFLGFESNPATNLTALANLPNLKGLDLSYNSQANFQQLASLTNLTSLYLSGSGITNLSFVQNLKQLTNLSVCANQVMDVSPLTGLSNLRILNFAENAGLVDFSVISTLTNLESLSLNGNSITNLAFLQSQSHLTALNIDANLISSFSPIAGLINLNILSAQQNLLTNTSDLSPLTNLLALNLNQNFISNPTLPQLPNLLISLSLSSNNIATAQPLASLTNLQSLDLSANSITDFSGFAGLSNLSTLSLYANSISNIAFLQNLRSLSSLDLHNNLIADISPLATLTNLSELNLAGNLTANFSPLANLANVTSLDLSSNPITDWTPINNLTNLAELYVQNESLSDLSFLPSAANLAKLDITFNRITNLAPVNAFKGLHYFLAGHNRLIEISDLSDLPRLWYTDLRTNLLDISPGSGSAAVISALSNRLVSVDYLPQNQRPTISLPAVWPIPANTTSSPLGFDVSDDVTASNLLTVTALSSNVTLIPNSNIQLGITSSNRTLTVTPITGKAGNALLTLTVTDETGLNASANVFITVVTQQNVSVPDANLRASIRSAIGRPSGALNNVDLLNLTQLIANYAGIADLTGLEWASNLNTLTLTGNSVSNLSKLQNLPGLRSLTLDSNPITDFSQLAILTNLTGLSLAGDSITNLSFLNNLTALTSLNLNNNLVADLSPLTTLPNLGYLFLSQNIITNINPLLSLPYLTDVDLTLNLLDTSTGSAALAVISTLQLYGSLVFYVPQRSPPAVIGPTTWRIPANFPSFLAFNVVNSTPPAASLVVAATSSNTGLLPNANLSIYQNPDQSWVLKAIPLSQSGDVTVTLSVTDNLGSKGSQPIAATVVTPGSIGSQFLNSPNLNWTTWGNAQWFGESTVTHDGISAAQSGHINDSQESWLGTTVVGPGKFSFWWRVSSEANFDFLQFFLNNDAQAGGLSGEIGWQQKVLNIPVGTNVLRWGYIKDQNTSMGTDAGWLDEVNFSPGVWLELVGPPVNGQAQLLLHAIPGNPYEVQVSTNLVDWTRLILITPTNSSTPVFDNVAGNGTRFYRLHDLSLIYFETPIFAPGSIHLVLHSPSNLPFLVLTSTNLKDWTSVATITNTLGTVQFTDSLSSSISRRFYRAQLGL